VLSQLDCCNVVLTGLLESTIRLLQRVQNATARLIIDAKQPRNHITPVLTRLHWLPIKLRIVYKLCLMMHLIHTSQRPAYMTELVELTAACSSRSASHLLYWKPDLKTKFGEPAFSHASPAAWNSLPDYIQSDSNTEHF